MNRVLYHGSDHVVERPLFGAGKPYNDYGSGFYCTEHRNMAAEWAVGFDHDGFINRYELDMDGLVVVNLESPEFCTLNWLAVLLANRHFDIRAPLAREARAFLLEHFAVDLSRADVVEGYRADDSYFTFAQDFISGSISYRQLCTAVRLGELGHQVMVKSPRAFDRLRFVDAEQALREDWLARRAARDRDARSRYFDGARNSRMPGDLFIMTIIDEGMEADDERLR